MNSPEKAILARLEECLEAVLLSLFQTEVYFIVLSLIKENMKQGDYCENAAVLAISSTSVLVELSGHIQIDKCEHCREMYRQAHVDAKEQFSPDEIVIIQRAGRKAYKRDVTGPSAA